MAARNSPVAVGLDEMLRYSCEQSLNKQLAAPMWLWVGLRESWDSQEFSKETAALDAGFISASELPTRMTCELGG